jgi:phage tail sheath gpL-like
MSASVVLTGLSTNDPTPGTYLQIAFAQGQIAGFQGQRPILLVGNKTSAGSAVADTTIYGPDTTVPCQNENDCINLTGAGSELHRMWRRTTSVNAQSKVYFIVVAASAGTAATLTFTLANVPTTAGTLQIYVGDTAYQYSYAASATLASITAGMVAAISGNPSCPCTPTQSTVSSSNDSVLVTVKTIGPRGNWLRGQAQIIPGNGPTSNMTVTNTSDAYFAGGATADSNTNALATIAAKYYYYIASAAEDATQVGAFSAQLNTQALPVQGLRQRLFVGSSDTSGNVATIANAVNNPRVEFIWSQASPWTPAEIAAYAAGLYALYELVGPVTKPKVNWSGYGGNAGDIWTIPQSRNTTLTPTRPTIFALLGEGVTPIGWRGSSGTYLVKRITSYSLNGASPDYRIRDAGKVTICDFFGDDLVAITNANWSGKTFAPDPVVGAPTSPDNTTVSPNAYRLEVFGLLDQWAQINGLVNIAATKAAAIVQQNPANTNRMDVALQLFPCSPCDQFGILIAQVG